jgi:hypothetical protein
MTLDQDPETFRKNGIVTTYEPKASFVGKPRAKRLSTADLMAKKFEPIKWIVPGYISEGLSILAGRQKLGKSFLAVDWALAVAAGGMAMASVSCEQGNVLYVDLENGERRIQQRLISLGVSQGASRYDRLEWLNSAPALDAGFTDILDQWRREVKQPRLVVIDVLQRIKPPGKRNQNSYESDYAALAELQSWATTHGIAIVALHHTRKAAAEDPLEALNGSNGIAACADTTLVLNRDQNGRTLYVRGRDVEEKETALNFINGHWSVIGEASDVRISAERRAILECLNDHGTSMSPTEIAGATGMKAPNVKQLLHKMAKEGTLSREKGRYDRNGR